MLKSPDPISTFYRLVLTQRDIGDLSSIKRVSCKQDDELLTAWTEKEDDLLIVYWSNGFPLQFTIEFERSELTFVRKHDGEDFYYMCGEDIYVIKDMSGFCYTRIEFEKR